MVDLTFAPAMNVTQNCVRRRFRFAACRACVDVCPVQAFSLTDDQLTPEPARCIECGDCLFVCPDDAITGVTPQTRFLSGDTLAGPFTGPAPTVNELLLWHAQRGVRFISIEAEQSTAWMVALARLNLALRRLGEPAWSFKLLPEKEINAARRALIHVPREDVKESRVEPGKRRLRQAFSHFSDVDLVIDAEKCVLCGACWRSCQEKAIRFEEGRLLLETARCTGCGGCEAVCLHQALTVVPEEGIAKNISLPASPVTCTACGRPFWTFHPEEKRCHLCQRHPYSMRNQGCC